MKSRNILISIMCLGFIASVKSQEIPRDTMYGKVKKIKSKVIFLTKKENHQFLYYDDYGHSGFMGPESTIAQFYSTYYNSEGCYYLNYERYLNEKGKIIKDNWYGKKDDFIRSYKNIYNEKDTLITEVDSSESSISTTRHYYDYNGENIIFTNPDFDFFSHRFIKYKDGKIIRTKRFDEHGVVDEYIYKYNSQGKLKYRVYKNPNSWKKVDERSWAYGPQDSIGHVYNDIVNEYDTDYRLKKTSRYDLYADPNHEAPYLTGETTYSYVGSNLRTSVHVNTYTNNDTYRHYVYDRKNRLIEKYCCDEDISQAKIIQKYRYNKNLVTHLDYTEENWSTKQKKLSKIEFKYKFDKLNNWTEIVKIVDGIEMYKWIREIQYY